MEAGALRPIHQFVNGVHAGSESKVGGIIASCMDVLASDSNVRLRWARLESAAVDPQEDWALHMADELETRFSLGAVEQAPAFYHCCAQIVAASCP